MRRATFGTRPLAALALAATVVVAASHAERAQASVAETVGTFGTTIIGASSSSYTANRKQVGRYPLPTAGSVTKLSIHLAPTGTKGQQVMRGIIYADASGKPQALLGASEQLTFKSTSSAGWYELKFPSPVTLTAGSYWIGVLTGATGKVAGFRFTKVTAARNYNANTYSSGPSNPFGSGSIDAKQTSLYATYIQGGAPVEISPPAISGTAQQGQTLTEAHGSWSNEPTGYAYQWLQCDSLGSGCLPIAGATSQTYVPVAADVGHALKVEETATNAGGSGSATSAATAAVAAVVVIPPPPANSSPPTISGSAQQGQTLTEAHGSWTNEPTGYAYQWLQCDSLGSGCLAIAGATSQTYVPVAADVGHALKVEESATNAGGSGSATSAATAAVAAVVVNTAGAVKYRLDAKSYCDSICTSSTWLQEHISSVLGYGSYGESHYAPFVPSMVYLDAYTKWGSFGLTAQRIKTYEGECKSWMSKGKYVGIFSDDIEFASGQHQAGTPLQVAELVEACRRGAGPGAVIAINTQYADLHTRLTDPTVAKALAVTDRVDNEFGVNRDSSIKNPSAYTERLSYIDALHAKGIQVEEEDVEAGKPASEYEVASYLLINDGQDYWGTYVTPSEWSPAWGDLNLGEALGPRELVGSVWRRRFAGGTVYVDPTGGPTQTIDGHTLLGGQGLIA